jgi:tRNA uridine 5-carboxymethylaminomethyl modification enzyme
VLVDDLVITHPTEPYRMFTSRAEFRLLLRQDNGEARLHEKAFHAGLIPEARYETIRERVAEKQRWLKRLETTRFRRGDVVSGDNKPDQVDSAAHLLKRPDVELRTLIQSSEELKVYPIQDTMLNAVEIELRYSGYLERERRLVEKLRAQEEKHIPESLNYDLIKALSAEGRQKLLQHLPATIGQASRISGVTPSDLALVVVYMRNFSSISKASEPAE